MLTQSELKLLMSYDPDTGVLTWNVRPDASRGSRTFNGRNAGKPVGTTKNSTGYVNVRLGGRTYTAHRLVWLYVHGCFPDLIDHVDRDRTNNRLSNLRLATKAQNNFNRLQRQLVGVRKTPTGRWRATIGIKGKKFHLGTFDRFEDASHSYWVAAADAYGMTPVIAEAVK